MELNKTHIGDCMELSKQVPDDYVDLIVTSPPYADTVSYGDEVNVFSPENYPDWILPLFKEANRFLKPTGSFILNSILIEAGNILKNEKLFPFYISVNMPNAKKNNDKLEKKFRKINPHL